MIKPKLKTASVEPEQNPNPGWGGVHGCNQKIMEYGASKKLQPDFEEEVRYRLSLLIMNSVFNISSSSGTLFIMYEYWTARDSNYKLIDFFGAGKKIMYKLKLFIIGVSWQLPMLLIAVVRYLILSGTGDVYLKRGEAATLDMAQAAWERFLCLSVLTNVT